MAGSNDDYAFRQQLRAALDGPPSAAGDLFKTKSSDALSQRLLSKQARIVSNAEMKERAAAEREGTLAGYMGAAFGYDPEGVLSNTANIAASVQAGAARTAGDVAEFGFDQYAKSMEENSTPEQMAAYQRLKSDGENLNTEGYQTQATDDDIALLNQRFITAQEDGSKQYSNDPEINAQIRSEYERLGIHQQGGGTADTVLDRLQGADTARGRAQSIDDATEGFADSWVYQGDRDKLQEASTGGGAAISKAWEGVTDIFSGDDERIAGGTDKMAEGISETATVLGKMLDEPQAILEYIADTGGQLAIGALPKGMMAQTLGYASDAERKGILKYQKENNGQLPDAETQKQITKAAVKAGALNYLGQAKMLSAVANPFKPGAAISLSGRASVARTVKATGSGAAVEGGTEALQTYYEGEAALTPSSADEIFLGGFIGAAAGGAMSGGARGIAEVGQASEEHMEAFQERMDTMRAEAEAKQAEAKANIEKVAEEKEAGELADPQSPNFNPEQALIGLYQSLDEESATPEQKLETQDKIDKLIGDASVHVETRRELLEVRTPEGQALQHDLIKQMQDEGDTTTAAVLQNELDTAMAMTEEEVAAETKRLNGIEEKIKATTESRNRIEEHAAPPLKSQEAAAPVVEAAVKGDRDSGDALLVMAMRNPNSLSTEQLDQVAQSTDLDMPTEQREYLSALSKSQKSQQQLKTLENVTTDIITGGKGFKGVEQYRSRTQALLRIGRTSDAVKQIKSLNKFADQHTQKAEAIRKAYNEIKGTQHSVSLVRDTDGAWKRVTRKVSRKERKDKTGLTIDARSFKLADTIDMEAQVVRDSRDELNSAIAVAQGLDTRAAEDVEETGPETQTERETSASEDSRDVLDTDLTTNAPAADITTEAPAPVEGPTSSIAPADLEPAVTTPVPPRDQAGTTPAPARPVAGTVTVQTPESTGAAAIDTVSAVTDEQGQRVASVTLAREDGVSGLVPRLRIGRSVAKDPARAVSVATQAYQQIQSQNEGVRIYAPAEAKMSNQLKPVWNQLEQEGTAVRDENSRLYLAEPVQEAAQEPAQEPSAAPTSEATPETTEAAVEPVAQPEGEQQAEPVSDEDASLDAMADQEAAMQEEQDEFRAADDVVQSAEEVAADLQEEAVPEVDQSATGEIQPAERVRKETPPSRLRTLLTTRPKYQRLKAEEFRSTNLAEAYLRQGKTENAPLAEEGDFVADLMNDVTLAEEYLAEELTAKQTIAMMKSAQMASGLRETIKSQLDPMKGKFKSKTTNKMVSALRPDYYYTDWSYFLRDEETGQFDANVENAIALAAVQAIVDLSAESPTATAKDINRALGRREDATVPGGLSTLLGQSGVRARTLHNSVGANITKSLGIKLKPGAPESALIRLQTHLGARAIAALEAEGIITVQDISQADIHELLPEDEKEANLDTTPEFQQMDAAAQKNARTKAAKTVHTFVRLKRDGHDVVHPGAADLVDSSKGTANILSQVIKTDSRIVMPSFEPIKFSQVTAKNSPMGIPKFQRKVLEKEQAKKHFLKEDMGLLLDVISRGSMLAMFGVAPEEGVAVHDANAMSLRGKNDALIREYDNLVEWKSIVEEQPEGLNTGFTLPREVWKMQRVGISSNMFNPLGSKIHRQAMYMEGWETEIDTMNMESLNSFMLAVADGLDIATDKQGNALSLEEIYPIMRGEGKRGPAIKAGVEALETLLGGTALEPHQEADLVAAVKGTEGKAHGLAALLEFAKMNRALKSGQTKFTTTLLREVDGVTNGPILTQLMLGAAANQEEMIALMEKGGMFTAASGETQYGQWRGKHGNQDLYESLASAIHTEMSSLIEENPKIQNSLSAVEFFTGKLYDEKKEKLNRNMVKKPLTALVFGSSVGSAVKDLALTMEESYYKKIEDLANENLSAEVTQAKLNTIVGNMNTLLAVNDQLPAMNIQRALKTRMTPSQLNAMVEGFSDSMGEAIKNTFESKFEVFLNNRQKVNAAAQTAFELYNAAYEAMYRSAQNQMAARGELPIDPNNKDQVLVEPDQEQMDAIHRQLEPIFPTLHSPMSLASQELDAGIFLGKNNRELNSNSQYGGNVRIKGRNNITTQGLAPKLEGPGVAGLILGMHSTDSAISTRAYSMLNALNVHDANALGINNIAQGAQNLNRMTLGTMANYSLPSEMANALDRVLENFESVMGSFNGDPQLLEDLKEINAGLLEKGMGKTPMRKAMHANGLNAIGYVALEARTVAQQADRTKLEFMQKLVAVDQYGFEGGNYVLEPTDYTRLEHAAKRIPSSTPEAVNARAAISDLIPNISAAELQQRKDAKDKGLAKKRDVTQAPTESIPTPEVDVQPVQSLTGEPAPVPQETATDPAGSNDVASNPVIIDLVERFHNKPVHDLVKAFVKETKNPQYRGMARAMLKSLPKSAMVRVSKQGRKQGKNVSPLGRGDIATARFDAKADTPFEIWFRNSNNVNRQVTEEVLVHELVHMATNVVIGAVQQNGTDNVELQQLVDGLETLLADAQALVKEQGLGKWQYATSNVFEMVSFGMTNPKFQQEVMSKLEVTPEKHPALKGNSLLSGMRAFIQYLSNAVFGKQSPKYRNGLTTLIAYTAGIQGATRDAGLGQDLSRSKLSSAINGSLKFAYRPSEIFDALTDNNQTGEDTEYLRDLLAEMVESVHGPMGALKEEAFDGTDPVDGFLEAVVNDRLPFASGLSNSGYAMTDREAYVAEQLHATFLTNIDGDQTAYREMSNLWHEAKNALKEKDFHQGDWSKASNQEKALAKQRRDFLFDLSGSGRGRSDHIARFAAASMTLPVLRDLMDFQTADRTKSLRGMKIGEALQELFRRATAFINGIQLKVKDGQTGSQRMKLLAQRLTDVDAKNRSKVLAKDRVMMDRLDDATEAVGKAFRGQVEAFGRTKLFRKSRYGVIRFAGSAMSTVAGQRAEEFANEVMKLRNKTHKDDLPGLAASLFNEARGAFDGISTNMQTVFREVTKANEHRRMQVMTVTKQLVVENFTNNGKDLTKAERRALTPILIRTGLSDLTGTYDMAAITDLVTRPGVRKQEIQKLESRLDLKSVVGRYYLNASKDLGHFLATGKSTNPELMRNAHNIAHLGGLVGESLTAVNADQHIETIDALATLYALEYSRTEDLRLAGNVMRQELPRGNQNGAEATLLMAKAMQKQSKEDLFENSEALMTKGYASELLDPNISMKVATESEGKQLERMGWERHGKQVLLDKHDPDKTPRALYTIRDGGNRQYLSGMVSMTSEQSQGSDMYARPGASQTAKQQAQQIQTARKQSVAAMLNRPASYDPRTVDETFAIPLLNKFGETVTHRYMMTEDMRDTVLRRQNDIGEVMGGMAGSLYDKPVAKEQNKAVIDALFESYTAEVRTNGDAYVEVSATSTNPSLREAWSLLPPEAKEYAAQVWGAEKMMVRGDLADMTFGYRRSSIVNLLTNDGVHESTMRDVIANTFASLANMDQMNASENQKAARVARVARRIKLAEDVWMEVVKHVKDILVVKSGITLAGNVSSNLSLLAWYGVTPSEIVRDHKESIEGLIHYRRDLAERDKLQAMLDAEYVDSIPAAQQRIAELNDALDRNKVKMMIDAGMLPTIVEDVDLQDDSFSFQSRAQEKLSKLTDHIPKPLRTTAKWMYMAHDTPLYKIMSQGTQMSDFVARYTLYKHATSRKRNPLDHKKALQVASDMFINYDIPSHRHLNYANEAGILMFTKYYIRVQKTIMHLYQEHPARAMALTALTGFLPGLPVLMDSAFWHRLYSPLRAGALEAPGTLDEIGTVNAALSVF